MRMKPVTYALVFYAFLTFHGMASDSPEDRFLHPSFKSVPPPSHLPAGKEPGTYRLSTTCTVDFSRQTDFPATITIVDYAKKELYRQTVTSTKPFTLTCDVRPGTYEAVSKPARESAYWNATGFDVHIDAQGVLAYTNSHSWESPTFWHVRKIEIISPDNLATLTAKTIKIGQGSDAESVIPGNDVVLKWKAIPGVKAYTVRIWPMESPSHPDSFGGDWDAGGTSKTNELHLKRDSFLHLKCGYAWTVTDGDEDDIAAPYSDGHFARGSSVFLTPGAKEYYAAQADRAQEGDEWIDPKIGIRFRQNHATEGDPQHYVLIDAVGPDSPAIGIGLSPGLLIFTVNGASIVTLDDLRASLAKIAHGTMVSIGVGKEKEERTLKFSVN